MERGLFWLPLLLLFAWLAWSGWHEYQKVEAYQKWAEQFEKAKYDIYAVLGYRQKQLTWGTPTPTGPINLKTISLEQVGAIRILVKDQLIDLNQLPEQGAADLELVTLDGQNSVRIPFTEIALAARWQKFLVERM